MLPQYMARQLSHPTGLMGRYVLGVLWNRRNRELNEFTLVHLDLNNEDSVLDIGFGGGYLLERMLPQVRHGFVAGIDASRVMVENSQKHFQKEIKLGRMDIQYGLAEAIPFSDGSFTRVSSVNSLFYWKDISKGIAEIFRVLREGGKIVLTYTERADIEKKAFAQYGVKAYPEEEIRQRMEKAGFIAVHSLRTRDRHRKYLCTMGEK